MRAALQPLVPYLNGSSASTCSPVFVRSPRDLQAWLGLSGRPPGNTKYVWHPGDRGGTELCFPSRGLSSVPYPSRQWFLLCVSCQHEAAGPLAPQFSVDNGSNSVVPDLGFTGRSPGIWATARTRFNHWFSYRSPRLNNVGLVSTRTGDRLGTPGAVGSGGQSPYRLPGEGVRVWRERAITLLAPLPSQDTGPSLRSSFFPPGHFGSGREAPGAPAISATRPSDLARSSLLPVSEEEGSVTATSSFACCSAVGHALLLGPPVWVVEAAYPRPDRAFAGCFSRALSSGAALGLRLARVATRGAHGVTIQCLPSRFKRLGTGRELARPAGCPA